MTSTKVKTTMEFKNLLSHPNILKNLVETLNFSSATPIQEAVIPAILEGRDVYAGAKTGSGKTMAFLAPVAEMLFTGKIKKALVLSPVRELALQIDEEAMKVLGEDQNEFVSIPLYGGVPLDQQMRAMKTHNPKLLIATPGRMIDFMSSGSIELADIDICILDEADRMCDMGFSDQVVDILRTLPNCKQFLMFSATLPKEANEIMNRFLNNPVEVAIDPPNEANQDIRHEAYFVGRNQKIDKIDELLSGNYNSVMIFGRTRKGVDRAYTELKKKGHSIAALHAGFSMGEREKTIRAFKEGKIKVLVCTDVASRGLDVDTVDLVINHEMPEATDDYIHRSGRTGRAGKKGLSVILIDSNHLSDRRMLQELEESMTIEKIGKPGNTPSRSAHNKSNASPSRDVNSNNRGSQKRRSSNRSRSENSNEEKEGSTNNRRRRHHRGPRSEQDPHGRGKRGPSQNRGPRKKKTGDSQNSKKRSAQKTTKSKSTGLLSKTKSVIGKLFGKKKPK